MIIIVAYSMMMNDKVCLILSIFHILLALILIFANCRHDVSFCAMVCNGMGIFYTMFYNGIQWYTMIYYLIILYCRMVVVTIAINF